MLQGSEGQFEEGDFESVHASQRQSQVEARLSNGKGEFNRVEILLEYPAKLSLDPAKVEKMTKELVSARR